MISFKEYLTESAKRSHRKNGVVYLYLTPAVENEIQFLEIDTLDPSSPKEKHELVHSMNRRKCLSKGKCKIMISEATLKYIREQFLPNAIYIAKEGGTQARVSALETFQRNISHL